MSWTGRLYPRPSAAALSLGKVVFHPLDRERNKVAGRKQIGGRFADSAFVPDSGGDGRLSDHVKSIPGTGHLLIGECTFGSVDVLYL